MIREGWIDKQEELALRTQCELCQVNRTTWYARQHRGETISESDQQLMQQIDEIYTQNPFYGSRRIVKALKKREVIVNRKRVQRLMRLMGLAAMVPGPHTSKPHPEHKIYPYLLRGVTVTRPNQVWSSDITYIRLAHGFVYLVAIIDWYSRKVLSWRVSNSMETAFCLDALDEALERYGTPEIFNSDQGSQFTSTAFTDILKQNSIEISMDGRGRALDNIFVERLWRSVKYENIYLMGYSTMKELIRGLTNYFGFYNRERPHQSLDYHTPHEVYKTGLYGGATIVDHFNSNSPSDNDSEMGQRHSAAVQ